MGDRANVKIKERTGTSIYVYTHWEGHEWPEKLREALRAGRERWHHDQYLQRFLITELCKDADGLTGYGVSTFRGDNEHDVFEVDMKEQKVRKLSEEGWFDGGEWNPKVLEEWTFAEYTESESESLV